jgi:hypothetical protein
VNTIEKSKVIKITPSMINSTTSRAPVTTATHNTLGQQRCGRSAAPRCDSRMVERLNEGDMKCQNERTRKKKKKKKCQSRKM